MTSGADHDALDDDALLRLAATADTDGRLAFEALVRRHQAWLVRLLFFLLGRQAQAEDVAQETFVRAYLALKGGEAVKGLRPWLRTIATRLAFNLRRDAKTRQRTHEAAVPDGGEPVAPGPEGRASARNLLEQLLPQLSYPYREVLILRHVEELSVEEISELLGIGLSAAKMRLARAREQFMALHQKEVTNGS